MSGDAGDEVGRFCGAPVTWQVTKIRGCERGIAGPAVIVEFHGDTPGVFRY